MTLSRRDLEEGRMRTIYTMAVDPKRALSDDALAASLARTLAERPKQAGWWVFAYGSLLWNPLFPFEDARPATIRGVHRSFCLWSMASRGTCDQPGLVLGLEPGGACRGVVYRLPARFAKQELALLWRREMVIGAYRPRWMRVRAAGRELTALSFVVDRKNLHYARDLSIERKAQVLACAAGAFGSSADYLEHTRIALITHGIVDPYLEALAEKVAKLRRAE
ncbi:MAG: gamma-glutamylcyclotransferase [Casimicrobiaceae bacterium]